MFNAPSRSFRTLIALAGVGLVAAVLSDAPAQAGDDSRHVWTQATLKAAINKKKNRKFCEKVWPAKKTTTEAEDRRCSAYWSFHFSNGAMWCEFDPRAGEALFMRQSAETLLKLARRAEALCKDTECLAIDEEGQEVPAPESCAAETFKLAASEHYALDADIVLDYDWVFDIILEGKRLPKRRVGQEDAWKLGATHLRKLRNAVYARHGRPFKDKDLHAFFYEAEPKIMRNFPFDLKVRKEYKRLPLKVNPDFKESMLTPADKHNIRLIRAQEKRDWGY